MPLYHNVLFSKKTDHKSADNSTTLEDGCKTEGSKPVPPSAGMKFLQDHLLSKKRSKQSSSKQPKIIKQNAENRLTSSENTLPIRRFCGEQCGWDPQDEYDPTVPNSYEILQADYLKAEERRLLIQQNRSSRSAKIDTSILDALEQLEDIDNADVRSPRGTAIAPPSSLQCSSSAIGTPPLEKSSQDNTQNIKLLDQQGSEKLDGSAAAEKILFKMGYKAGQGLGKDEQGISEPLEVELIGDNLGRIVQRSQVFEESAVESPKSEVVGPERCDESHTRVVLLQNMVGPGEVDDDLEAETKEECTKYGEVVKCLIYEIPNKRVPDDQAVRIFVEFKTKEAAQRASNDLNGRYFGGRIVKTTFYDVDKFSRYELGP